jgi:hypothetical protein
MNLYRRQQARFELKDCHMVLGDGHLCVVAALCTWSKLLQALLQALFSVHVVEIIAGLIAGFIQCTTSLNGK